jgi:heat-inducible transcriptional repressor
LPPLILMLDERKTAILRAVVREYIETAQPVGSAHVARDGVLAVSAATVRNEMAVLEQEGFLAQPHTSAGRVPTDKGYRYFVDHLTQPGRLDDTRTLEVREFFHAGHGALEQLLADTSRLLSRLTNYASVVIRPPGDVATIKSAQIVRLSSRMAVCVGVMSDGAVENVMLELSDDVTDARLSAASVLLERQSSGKHLGDPGAVHASGDATTDVLATTAWTALQGTRADNDQAFVGGASRVAQAFDAVDTVRQVLAALDHQYVVVSLLRDVTDRGLSVAIGTEHGVEPLAACSVVVAPYRVDGETVGSIGVLGPTRMNYPQALAAVEAVSEQLGRTLTEG